ncbi:flagellar hook-associated protein FlgK [Hydrogenispora ethanolica]|nr:flagellar hook-associated protein FlgK [Hydrogenispora ethanolica]
MSSTFMGLSIATRGLYSSQAGLSVTSNNISNTNTEGYSRQTVAQTSVSTPASTSGGVIIGGGSEVTSVERIRQASLDNQYWRANTSLGEWEVKADALTEIETVFSDSTDDGFSTVMNDFYDALEELSNNASDTSVRTSVEAAANSLCEYLNNAAAQLEMIRDDLNTSVKTTVDQINSYAQQIAKLNDQIQQATAGGATANELEDQRTLLLDKLSGLVDISVSETVVGTNPDGTVNTILNVTVNGSTLVSGDKARQLECTSDSDGLYQIQWQDTGEAFEPDSGALKGYLDIRDGAGGSEYKGIPYYLSQLDEFARTFAEAFNEGIYADGNTYYAGHAGGYSSDGSTGIRFFTYDDCSSEDFMNSGSDTESRYANITAANISVALDIQEDVGKIAASSSAGQADNSENIADLIELCQDSQMFNKGTPEDFMNSIISTLGTSSSYAQRLADNKSTIANNIDERRTSVSGVSADEETANLTKYQQAYNSSALLVTTWNEIYQTTIDMVNE